MPLRGHYAERLAGVKWSGERRLRPMQYSHASAANICIFSGQESAYLLGNTKELIMNVFAKLKKNVADRRAMRELSALDDRALQDLGISRSNIQSAVKGLVVFG